VFILFFFFSFLIKSDLQKDAPVGLLCGLLPYPELSVVRDTKAFLRWIRKLNVKGDYQFAYQIEVATTKEFSVEGSSIIFHRN